MFRQLINWLGPLRTHIIIGTLILTGLTSLALQVLARDAAWSLTGQTVLVLVFLLVATLTISSRLHRGQQQRLWMTIGPALGLAGLGLFFPGNFTLFLGAAFGWLLASQFFVKDRMRMEYKKAIKLLRDEDYKGALRILNDLIKEDKENPEHYQFRAQLNRLAGKLDAAIHDYRRVINLEPEAASGYNGLSEVYLQMGKYEQAHENAAEACRLQPAFWVAPYNLGMVEDRLGNSEAAIEHLNAVLKKGLPDSRHRLLTNLWLARAYHRINSPEAAEQALSRLRKESAGLKEWKMIFEASGGQTVKKLLENDIKLAERAIQNEVSTGELFKHAAD